MDREFHSTLLSDWDGDGGVQIHEAALFANSIFEGSGSWFSCAYGLIPNMEPRIFRETLLLRLLINPLTNSVVNSTNALRCNCSHAIVSSQDGFHLLCCPEQKPRATRRHTFIMKYLAKYLKQINTPLLPYYR